MPLATKQFGRGRASFLKRIQRTRWLALLTLLLWISVEISIWTTPYRNDTLLIGSLSRVIRCGGPSAKANLWRMPDGTLRLHMPEVEPDWTPPADETPVIGGRLLRFNSSRGLIAGTVVLESWRVYLNWCEEDARHLEPVLRQALADEWDQRSRLFWNKPAPMPPGFLQSDVTVTRVRPLGLVQDAITLSLAGLLAFAAFTRLRAGWRLESRRVALARGLCPSCRYDLRGLRAPVCPECGAALDRSSC